MYGTRICSANSTMLRKFCRERSIIKKRSWTNVPSGRRCAWREICSVLTFTVSQRELPW